jgi:transposase
MIYAGIDVAKDKHDCLIVNSNGKALSKVFTITNNKQGFNELFANLKTHSKDLSKLKVGLEATGHYSNNLLEFLIANDLPTTVINPLHIMTIPGISYRMAAIIIAETGNFVDFDKAENTYVTHCLMQQNMSAIGMRDSNNIYKKSVLRVNLTI